MFDLTLIGIGTGNPEHLTLQAVRAINAAEVILIPRKGAGKADLAELRRVILAAVLTNASTQILEFDLPVRNEEISDYILRVEDWHDRIAAVWKAKIGRATSVAMLVWGDPSLYDSTLRIAARLVPADRVKVIAGITAIQALTAAHAMTINEIGAPFVVTTGRRLRDEGFPKGVDTAVIMLDGECSFQSIDPLGVKIFWGGYVGMAEEIIVAGDLAEVGSRIIAKRAAARAQHGWIMDIYVLKRQRPQ